MNLIYSIAYGERFFDRALLMVKSIRELGEFSGDILIYTDIDREIPGAITQYQPDLSQKATVMALRWHIGRELDLSGYQHVAMIDGDVIAIKPIQDLFLAASDEVWVTEEFLDGRTTEGNSPWSIEGIPFDGSLPVHNCGTVFGHAQSWKAFSTLMCNLMDEFYPRIHSPYPWIDQQILNHIERHGLFRVKTLPADWVFIPRPVVGCGKETKMVHCIPGSERVAVMHLAYGFAKQLSH